ncbi:MAG: radical SAM protein [Clostridiales bacterium]|nr:radical SAM protein [Clostridiales bacterium]
MKSAEQPSYYKLCSGVKLRGYQVVSRVVYYRYSVSADALSESELDLLSLCDGRHKLENTPLLRQLLGRNLIEPCEKNSQNEEWQNYRYCDNRYFPTAEISITGKCGFKCRHCFNAEDNFPQTDELSQEELLSLLAQFDECGIHAIEITGGEPLIHPFFPGLIREIAKRGMNLFELVTTAHHITEELLDELNMLELKPMFKISYDGIDHHDWFRKCPGAEERLLKNIELIKSKGFRIRIHMNSYRGNAEKILLTALLCDRLGVDIIQAIRTSEAPRLKGSDINDKCFTIDEYYEFGLKLIKEFIEAGGNNTIDIWQFLYTEPKSKTYSLKTLKCNAEDYRDNLPVCRRNRSKLTISSDGALVPCMPMSGLMKKCGINYGNVKTSSVKELLTYSPYLEKVCTTVGELKRQNKKCAECPYWKVCAGGCRVIGLMLSDGDYMAPDEAKCIFWNKYFRRTTEMMDNLGYSRA